MSTRVVLHARVLKIIPTEIIDARYSQEKNDWLQLGSGIKNPQSEGASKMRAVITIIFANSPCGY